MTPNIILLDENTANRIAAGEVIERPASAVKELVENAIDAGATSIAVSLEEGGKRRIEVADNGIGMGGEDAVLALQRHATSKIRSSDDLFAIRTLGFRGEALPSIASVSRLVLQTKTAEGPAGTRISVHGGEIESVSSVGARDGTTVVVEDLFFNTPARLKFLKSTPTEVSRAVEVVGHLALSHPHISFRLRHGAQEVLSTPGGGDPLGAAAAVWGREVARKLIPLAGPAPGISVTGFVATPDLSRPGRSHELFFVNRRPIRSRLLSHALEDAFRSLTPDARFPIGAVFIEISPDLVDVNVHPTKSEVKFTRDPEVHHAVSHSVKQALLAHGVLPTLTADARGGVGPLPFAGPPGIAATSPRAGRESIPFPGELWSSLPLPEAGEARQNSLGDTEPRPWSENGPSLAAGAQPIKPFADQLREFRVIGQARNTYIIALTEEGVAVIDQHVAHERVLYEWLTVKRREQGMPAQRLVQPFTLSLGAGESGLLRERLDDFAAAGWDIEPFGRDSFLVRTVPSFAARRSAESLLKDMVDELAHQSVARRLIVQREHVTITNACKMAVKAGDPLTIEEMTGLLAQLAETENPYLCPHGRPIVVTIPFIEIDRKFKRA